MSSVYSLVQEYKWMKNRQRKIDSDYEDTLARYDNIISEYEKIIREQADLKASEVVKYVIYSLQRLNSTLSNEDSGLTNVWNEVCVQVQIEQSFFWSEYIQLVNSIIHDAIKKKCTEHEITMLWMQTEAFGELEEKYLDNDDDEENFFSPLMDDIVKMILDKILEEASFYSNTKIENYINNNF